MNQQNYAEYSMEQKTLLYVRVKCETLSGRALKCASSVVVVTVTVTVESLGAALM